MRHSLLEILSCPQCRGTMDLAEPRVDGDEIVAGFLKCTKCSEKFPIVDSIPRFVPRDNYAGNFGLQWNHFRKSQLDSHSGVPISRDRFFRFTGWTPAELKGKRVLDVGCGAGRFAEIALSCGANVVAIDFSSAIEACWTNLAAYPNLSAAQADIYSLPFRPGMFDYVYCLGVLQHTPDVKGAFAALPEQLKPGGKLAVDVYRKTIKNWLWPKYWIRPVTRRLEPNRLFTVVQKLTPSLLALSGRISRVPIIGRQLRYIIPVAYYEGVYPLSNQQLKEWALLDTFDMFSPAYDYPQSRETLKKWAGESGLSDIEVIADGFNICRALRR